MVVIGRYKGQSGANPRLAEYVLSATVIVIVVCVLAQRQYAEERKHMFNNDQFVVLTDNLLFIVFCCVFIYD